MIRFDDPTADAIEAAVQEIETRTDVEVVVAIAPQSASWRSIPWKAGVAVAAFTALGLELVPWSVSVHAFLLEVSISGLLGGWLASRPEILARLIPKEAARQAVHRAARATFVDEAVHGTRDGLAILVYVSLLEERVALIPDLPLAGRVSDGALAPARRALTARDLPALLRGLGTLGDALARAVPATAQNRGPGLPDRPRFLS